MSLGSLEIDKFVHKDDVPLMFCCSRSVVPSHRPSAHQAPEVPLNTATMY